ncbi:ATP-binding protein [Cellulomonas denverensis]|uniref:histidine kinase n=1 Tax=Cellulomonas denverensis TaxID=264297 RepID=A0A7X6KU94_9CELL|nr:ATP-binding protein [Cellulomonas denverensis]NKY22084.1 hypothetical protein [Cellulomonas denverensis]
MAERLVPAVAETRRRGRSLRRIGSVLLTVLFLLGVLIALTDAVVLPLADVTARVDGDRLILGDGAQATRVPGLGALVALMRSAWGGLALLVLALAAAGLWCWPDLAGERTATWRVTVRRHVLAMTAVPVLVVLAAGWFLGSATLDDLREARDTEQIVAAVPAVLTATEAIQSEAGPVADEAARAAAVTATDDALRALSGTLAGSAADGAGNATRAVTGAEQRVAAARAATDPAVARQEWESAARSLDDLAEGWAAEVRDPAVAAAIRAAVATDRLAGTIEGEHRRVAELVTALAQLPVVAPVVEDEDTDSGRGTDRDEEPADPVVVPEVDAGLVRQAALAVAGVQAQRERTAAALAVSGDGLALPGDDQVMADARAVIAAGEPTLIAEPARATWADRAAAQTTQLRDLAAAELDLAADDAATAEAEARTATLGVLAVGSLLVVVVLLVAIAVMRRLGTRRTVPVAPVPAPPPVAPARTPEPEPARPAPVDTPHASEPAPTGLPMLIHVAQREQSLAARQLVLLDELEQSEVDPEVLSRLFELDNLATRSRRGAESVLVLAGSQTGRREREETALSDVVRIAAAQIEQYDRVRLELTDDPQLVGHAVVPLAHLLAELVENATVHSDPLLPVRVGAVLGADGIELTVTDAGLGMDAAERAAAAALVAGELPPEGRRLGLVVVGRLARSLGAQVEFPETAAGTVVRVRLPVSVVAAGVRPEGGDAGTPPHHVADDTPPGGAPEPDAMPTPERGQRIVPRPAEAGDTGIRAVDPPAPVLAPAEPPAEDLTVWDTRPRQDRDPEPATAPPMPDRPAPLPAPSPDLAVWDTRGPQPDGTGTGSGDPAPAIPDAAPAGDTGVWAPAELLDETTELPRREVGTDGEQPYRPEVAAPAAVDALAVRARASSSEPRDPDGLRARFQRFRSGVRDGLGEVEDAEPAAAAGGDGPPAGTLPSHDDAPGGPVAAGDAPDLSGSEGEAEQ